MNIFSLDCSTTYASVALMDGPNVITSESWHEERARHEGLFDISAGLMAKNGKKWSEIELFTVGRGPGAYSGLRVSLLAAQSLAAPGGIPVLAVSSMDAMAWTFMAEKGLDHLIVVGDARRNSFWYGRCDRASLPTQPTEWIVATNDQAPVLLSGAELVVSPHWEATAGIRERSPGIRWHDGPVIPTAIQVAQLALLRRTKQAHFEPLSPLYVHPAV
jgi:tRNA threonylcarbamoyl adenosine modification protein YeaZ